MDRIWAALIFFTRLPFWRLHEPPKECYQTVVEHWPLVGWLTGGIMAGTLWLSSLVFPYPVAVLLAIVMRMLVTVWRISSMGLEVAETTASESLPS